MTIAGLMISVGLSFMLLILIYVPLEWAFPAKKGQRFFRPAWLTDLLFMLGQYLIFSGLVF